MKADTTMTNRHTLFSVLLTTLAVGSAAADSAADWERMKAITPSGYVCYRAETAPEIDGRLDDAAWQAVSWTNDFVDIEGDRKPKPRFRTRAKMLWDDEHFYIAAEMQEPHVWGTLVKHDSVIFHDNDFEVFIDPNGDNHEYYELELNALNTTWDLFLPRPYKDGGKADNGWEIPGLRTAVHVDGSLNDPSDEDRGWSVEIAIPWRVLREFARRPTPPRDGDRWRVNFSRVEWQHEINDGKYQKVPETREDNWVWSPQGIIDMHRPERWGYVQFSTAKPRTVQFSNDPAHAGRELLMGIYHRQKSFHNKYKRWAATLDELGIDAAAVSGLAGRAERVRTEDGFVATFVVTLPGGGTQPWHVRQDSRLWTDATDDEQIARIEAVLWKQADAWNRGDIDAFMVHYWKSDRLTFSAGGETKRGWTATIENYRQRYPTRERMGRLKFSQLEVTSLGNTAALVLGRWHLQRESEPIAGNFTLVVRLFDDRWLIVHDHTSRLEQPAEKPPQP